MKRILFLCFFAAILLPGCRFIDLWQQTNDIILAGSGDIIYGDVSIALQEDTGAVAATMGLMRPLAASQFGYDLRYVAKAPPVAIGGTEAQANDLAISGSKAFIAYNSAGEVFRGAIQILDISDKKRPEIVTEIHFSSMDINAVLLDRNILLFGGAADPDVWGFRSFIGKIDVRKPAVRNIRPTISALSSYALTDIAAHGSYYYAAVGALNGGISILDTDLREVKFIPRGDIRSLDTWKNGIVALAGTTDTVEDQAQLLFIRDLEVTASPAIADFGSDYARASVCSKGSSLIFLALSDAGLRVYDAADVSASTAFLTPAYTQTNPTVAQQGLLATANSVSYDKNLLFCAHGEWGIRILDQPDPADLSGQYAADILGYFSLEGVTENGQNLSANCLAYTAQYAMIAAGAGGVYFIELR